MYARELYANAAGDITYTEGVMLSLAMRALEGDNVATSLFLRAAEKAEKFAPTDFYKDTHFVFEVVESREQWEEIQRREKEQNAHD